MPSNDADCIPEDVLQRLRNEPRARLLTNWAGAQDFESLLPHVGVHMVHDLGADLPLLPTGDFYLLRTVEFTFKTSGTVRCARAPARCSGRSGLRGHLISQAASARVPAP